MTFGQEIQSMSYFPHLESKRASSDTLELWCQVVVAWLLAMIILAVCILAFTGGQFPDGLHSAAAAGPLVAFLPDSILSNRGSFIVLYPISFLAAFLMARLPVSGVWLIVWIVSGAGFYAFRVAVAMTII